MNLLYISLALAVAGMVAAAYAVVSLRSLQKLRALFFKGTNNADLEEILLALHNGQQSLKSEQTAFAQNLQQLYNQLAFAVQKIGVVRFNPFEGSGGNFSFSVALLDNRGSGVVFTSLHGREQNRIYAKKITLGHSDSQLTEEEEQAIAAALQPPDMEFSEKQKKTKQH